MSKTELTRIYERKLRASRFAYVRGIRALGGKLPILLWDRHKQRHSELK